jgi:hypothetical protein
VKVRGYCKVTKIKGVYVTRGKPVRGRLKAEVVRRLYITYKILNKKNYNI